MLTFNLKMFKLVHNKIMRIYFKFKLNNYESNSN